MSVINSGKTFANGEQLSADKLNLMLSGATFQTSAVDNVSTQLSGGAIIVKDGGVSTAKIADDAVTATKLASDAVATANIADSNVTFAKLGDVIDDDTMATASDTTLATSESIKAYVDSFKPNFALATKSDTQTITGTENTWFEITNLNPTITTRKAGSTFIVTPSINWSGFNQAYGIGFKVMYSVNSGTYQDFGLPTGIGSRQAVHAADASVDNFEDMSRATFDVFFDSISYSAGDTISFKIYTQNPETSAALYINRSESDTDSNDYPRSISTIKVQEVFA